MTFELDVKEVRIAYVSGGLPESITEELAEMNATMYDDEGGGQYCLENVVERFDGDSDEYKVLNKLIEDGYDYLEYS